MGELTYLIMGNSTTIRLPSAELPDVPVHTKQWAQFGFRYAYARATDLRAAGEFGQDYLVIREDGRRLVFALCDGVSQSFFGDVAARIVGEALIDWLWEEAWSANEPTEAFGLEQALAEFLQQLTIEGSSHVDHYSLPDGLPPLIRDVLEQKRELGSESTFAAGLVDPDADRLILLWMGDSRIKLWGLEGECTGLLGNTFRTRERWSTRRGPVGEPHAYAASLAGLDRIIAYSDGLATLDNSWDERPDDATLDAALIDLGKSPSSDDISFLEIWFVPQRGLAESSQTHEPPAHDPPRHGTDEDGEGDIPAASAIRERSQAASRATAARRQRSSRHPGTVYFSVLLLTLAIITVTVVLRVFGAIPVP